MITIGFIKQEESDIYYYHVVNDKISVEQFSGEQHVFEKKFHKLKATMMLSLVEDFLSIDKEIIDRGKDVHVYSEKIKRLSSFLLWGHENINTLPESIVDNALICTKYMKSVIDLINKEHQKRKQLMFIKHCVESTCKDKLKMEANGSNI